MSSGHFTKSNQRSAKLTAERVLQIRKDYAAGKSQGAIARETGISVNQIGRIVRGECWQQVPAIPRDVDVDLTMLLDRHKVETGEIPPPKDLEQIEIEASLARTRRLLGEPAMPTPVVHPVHPVHPDRLPDGPVDPRTLRLQIGRIPQPQNTSHSMATRDKEEHPHHDTDETERQDTQVEGTDRTDRTDNGPSLSPPDKT